MRSRAYRLIAVLLPLPLVGACLTSSVLLTVRADGSGRFEQTTLIRPTAIGEFEKLAAPDAAQRHTPGRESRRRSSRDRPGEVAERPLQAACETEVTDGIAR
jgi:hypothetical protein